MHHTNRLVVRFVLATSCLLLASAASADDWPQWRGPARDGISKETGLLKQWPKEGPKLVWQVKDLAQLLYSSGVAGVGPRDCLRFARFYGAARWLRQLVALKAPRYRRHNDRTRGREAR